MIRKTQSVNRTELTSAAREELRIFLRSPAGVEMTQIVSWKAPSLLSGSDATAIICASGKREGYEECLENIFSLSAPVNRAEPEPSSSAYPSLDDDKKWDATTGEELTPKE